MPIAARIDEFGKLAWIGLMILGFWAWWPLGLLILAFTIGSGRMGCWHHRGMNRWQDHWQDKMDRMRSRMDWWGPAPPSSGNRAFELVGGKQMIDDAEPVSCGRVNHFTGVEHLRCDRRTD